jgi:hypothetical protein
MGVTPVTLSAGELEDEWAGEPGRRLRERYSFAGAGTAGGRAGGRLVGAAAAWELLWQRRRAQSCARPP